MTLPSPTPTKGAQLEALGDRGAGEVGDAREGAVPVLREMDVKAGDRQGNEGRPGIVQDHKIDQNPPLFDLPRLPGQGRKRDRWKRHGNFRTLPERQAGILPAFDREPDQEQEKREPDLMIEAPSCLFP